MLREIIRIDRDKCDGCGLCAAACVEGAIEIVDGKARLVSESYCDGLGACLGECPQGAITIEQREADPFDATAVEGHQRCPAATASPELPCGRGPQSQHVAIGVPCPGSMARQLAPREASSQTSPEKATPSELMHWPVQLRLVPPNAPFLKGADLLVVADCVPFALAGFHRRFLRHKCVVVGCPKLDDAEYYVGKLAEILKAASVKSLTVIRMEVPCCGGLVRIAQAALADSGRDVPFREITIGVTGEVLSEA